MRHLAAPLSPLALCLALLGPLGAAGCASSAQGSLAAPSSAADKAIVVPATFDVAELAARAMPTVVNITSTRLVAAAGTAEGWEGFFGPHRQDARRQGVGTGFVIDASGLVVTNAHVVERADDLRVRLSDGRELPARVVGRDGKLDLALLQVDGGGEALQAATLGTSEQVRVGEHVVAIGNPFGLGHTVTLGIVSAKARSIGAGPYDDFIQTDASINPGNSGGPLFNAKGEVVGINTAIRAGASGIGFAIPIDVLRDVLPQLKETGRVTRGKLGLVFQPVTADLAKALGLDAPRGALITDLEPGGPAVRAGLRSGDLVLAVNGVAVQHSEDLPRNVAKNPPGSTVKLSIVRGRAPLELSAKLDSLEEPPARDTRRPQVDARGELVQVSDVDGGVRVDRIVSATVRDLEVGDVIVELNGATVRDATSLRAELGKAAPGTTALLKLRRGRATRYGALPVPARP